MRRIGFVLALAAVVAALVAPVAPAIADDQPPAVIVVGLPGLQWKDVTPSGTPTLWRLAHTGSVGQLSVRSAADVTCAADGWLTVGAGNRVRVQAPCGATPAVSTSGGSASVNGWPAIVKDNHALDFGSVPGILASAMSSSGAGCVAAVGPGAALGAADRTGSVAVYSDTLTATALSTCPVDLVTGPSVATPADAVRADAFVASVQRARPAGSVLMVLGLADTDRHDRAHLHVAIAAGGPYGPGLLRSQSTRRAPYVQLIDVTATLLQLTGASGAPGVAAAVDGQPWQQVGHSPDSVAGLVDGDTAAGAVRAATPYAATFLVMLTVIAMFLTLVVWRWGRGRGATLWLLMVALAGPLASYLANLVPWWRSDSPTLVVILVIAGVAAVIGSCAFALAVRTTAVVAGGAVASVTFAVIVLDGVVGSPLQLDSVLGYSPLVAGRFMGYGNIAFGVLGTAAMLSATSVAICRPRSWPIVAGIGAVAVLADGAPMWGSDIGGVLALIPAFAVMVLLCAGRRVSLAKAALIGGAAVVAVFVLGLIDYARPASARTHLGRFVGKILHGGAWTVLDRKAKADVDLLVANVGTLVVPVIVAVMLWLVLRPRPRLAAAYARMPELRYGLLSLSVLALVGLVVNDSGLAIPAVAVLLGVPYVLAVLLRDSGDTTDTRTGPPLDDADVLP